MFGRWFRDGRRATSSTTGNRRSDPTLDYRRPASAAGNETHLVPLKAKDRNHPPAFVVSTARPTSNRKPATAADTKSASPFPKQGPQPPTHREGLDKLDRGPPAPPWFRDGRRATSSTTG